MTATRGDALTAMLFESVMPPAPWVTAKRRLSIESCNDHFCSLPFLPLHLQTASVPFPRHRCPTFLPRPLPTYT